MTTTEAEHEELVRRYLNDVTVEGNLDRLEEYVSEDWVAHSGGMPDTHGPEEGRQFLGMLGKAFPDLDVEVEDVIAEDDEVVVRSRYTGTHEGEFMGIDPTGATSEMAAIVIYRIEDGRIVEEWHQADMMGLMEQLGVGPSGE